MSCPSVLARPEPGLSRVKALAVRRKILVAAALLVVRAERAAV
jgi:hypothetical protein